MERAKKAIQTAKETSQQLQAQRKDLIQSRGILFKKRRTRLIEVRRLYYVEKWTQSEIAEHCQVTQVTIARDIRKLKELAETEASQDINLKKDTLDFLFEMSENYKSRIKELWKNYNSSANEFIRLKTLGEIREQEKHYINFLQSTGIVQKEPDKHLHAITYVSNLGKEKREPNEEKEIPKQEVSKNDVKKQVMAVTL